LIRFFTDHIYQIEDFLWAGGIVMVPLLMVSVLMWALIINRTFFFRRLYRKNISRTMAGEYVKNREFPDQVKYKGAITLLVTEFLKKRSGNSRVDSYLLDETVLSLVSAFDKYLAVIGVLAAMAPLLGLLGTVTGMIATFDIISVFGTGNARAMAGGISQALITTQTGLLVAIPGLYMFSFLTRKAENLKQRISSVGMYLRRYV
jgi:biopolymer transport protein ExbB